ncbi:M23 family metallopeptidase [Ammoniphilus sp. YIM 78166]|uniref:M23 family metallopeptidase n=1 Tax=Ammoniphilus sp. YIM 78166 TaxID=1644106 RepID=UPI0010703119|nr:M23 family metallopeptidase [Ammoniphilus sp. YIM 78166]
MSQDSIKRRREERLKMLREQMREAGDTPYQMEADRSVSHSNRLNRREFEWDSDDTWGVREEASAPVSSRFMLKALISLFLLSFTFLLYKTNIPYSSAAKDFVGQVMTREYNFQGMIGMVEKYAGGPPSILPSFGQQAKGQPQPVWNQVSPKKLLAPVTGTISAPFFLDGRGIQIEAPAGSEVKAVDQGWVIFVGEKEGIGQTIIVQHENQMQAWYGSLDQIEVTVQDWVQPGQAIGKSKDGRTVYFSMEMNGHYIDPTSVITFE